jgi:hypothetical protein
MTFELDGENHVLSDGISMITATTLFMYQVDYSKL